MALDSMNTKSLTLPQSVSSEIWAKAQESSVVMKLAERITLPGNGLTIPVVTGDPVAAWTAETEEKPVGKHTLTTKTMKGYTVALIEPFSNQFRANNEALYEALVGRLPMSIAKVFDQTVFGFQDAPGESFDTLAQAPALDVSVKTYDAFVDAIGTVSKAEADLNHWVLSPAARTVLLKAKDSNNRPLFISNASVEGAPNSVLSIPAHFSRHAYKPAVTSKSVEVVGFGGDWSGARYGIVQDINIAIADQASLSVKDGSKTVQLNLFQRNMFAVRIELEIGFVIRSASEFVRLENGTIS
ncbi:phage major capsid protein [Collinsella sp. zg1085]|uniref:phage major capsid protein n=1 Tax=Collinsella sp. zg1085 TaxID=2844380 RepID=UPI001C0CE885|nr:phage major capsid protein [Collinsella sp. zg1085]QWT18102.1 phage major capsid protein [Collinsella sp. zg1085]